jgi:small subunit ribosomal protein S4
MVCWKNNSAKHLKKPARKKGVTGENLIKLLEARLDNTVFRMGIAPSRQAARQIGKSQTHYR